MYLHAIIVHVFHNVYASLLFILSSYFVNFINITSFMYSINMLSLRHFYEAMQQNTKSKLAVIAAEY